MDCPGNSGKALFRMVSSHRKTCSTGSRSYGDPSFCFLDLFSLNVNSNSSTAIEPVFRISIVHSCLKELLPQQFSYLWPSNNLIGAPFIVNSFTWIRGRGPVRIICSSISRVWVNVATKWLTFVSAGSMSLQVIVFFSDKISNFRRRTYMLIPCPAPLIGCRHVKLKEVIWHPLMDTVPEELSMGFPSRITS